MFELYKFYFQKLCELHPQLLHSDTNKVFRLIHVEEAFGDFRNEIPEKKYFFRLIIPTYGFTDQGSDGRRKMQCGFLIGKYFDKRTQGESGYVDALENCRTIADDFFEKMIEDSRLGYPLFNHGSNKPSDLNWNAQVQNSTGDGTYAGLICTFEIEQGVVICIDQHNDDTWRQPTPEPPTFWLTAEGDFYLTADGGKFQLS